MKRNGRQPKRLREREGRPLSKYAEKGGAYKYGNTHDRTVPQVERGQQHRGAHRGSGARPFMQGKGNVR
jgi:hypothetical protein